MRWAFPQVKLAYFIQKTTVGIKFWEVAGYSKQSTNNYPHNTIDSHQKETKQLNSDLIFF